MSASAANESDADLERRFGGLRRLYGERGYARLRAARFVVVGLGGVGSWAVEALARCGVAELVLIDLDHVAESNIHRQVQALTPTLGQAKVQALAERIALIHPGCRVHGVEEFVSPDNWPALLQGVGVGAIDGLIDACDQVRAKEALARWSLAVGVPLVSVGAAGGKQRAEAVGVADLVDVTHDPLLAALRQRLRKTGAVPRVAGNKSNVSISTAGARAASTGVLCVFSREPVAQPLAAESAGTHQRASERARASEPPGGARHIAGEAEPAPTAAVIDGSLNCHGYGSSVMVTATFGMVAAGAAVAQLLGPH